MISCREGRRRHLSAFTMMEILIVVGVLAVLAAILIPVFNLARGRALSASCSGNLRQIGLALSLYAADNNDRYPHYPLPIEMRLCAWADRLAAYIPSTSTFDCPAAHVGKYARGCARPSSVEYDEFGFGLASRGSYDLNYFTNNHTRGVPGTRFRHPSTSISVLDGNGSFIDSDLRDMSSKQGLESAGVKKPRHRGGYNVLFMDGHVKWMKEDALRDPILWVAGNPRPVL